ncbi:MAG TPA: exosortase/archaeosortase family protein [Tepidisphaeraceae bacterium]|jgi:exosortase|nr:exosortase/archaeosortase family protein [Tepidisphaeraceae bacterium]
MSELSVLPGVQYAGSSDEKPRTYLSLSTDAWMRIGVLALLMIGLFWPNLRRLWLKTNPVTGEANWGHAFFIPLIGLYYLYLNRDALLKARVRTSYIGLIIMLGGLLLFAYGIWPGQNDFVKDFAMVVTLFGLVALMCGWEVMKIAWFPIAFLIAALPWPGLVYSWVALPLQQIAAAAAIKVLNLVGVESYREGTKLIIVNGLKVRVLNVAEACAGLKSLMTFISVGAAVGFLSSRATWQKILITLSAIPIAIFCNMMRVTGQGIIDHYWSEKLSEGFAHQFVGMVMLIPAFFLILLVAWILDNIFIEEADKRALPAPGSRSTLIEIPRTTGPKSPRAPSAPAARPEQPAPITAPIITQAAPARSAPAPAPRPAAAAKPAAAKPASATKPAPQNPAPAAKSAPQQPAPAANDLAAATQRLTSASIRRPRPQPNPPKPQEGK